MTSNKVRQLFADCINDEIRKGHSLNKKDKKHYINFVLADCKTQLEESAKTMIKMVDAGYL